MTHPPLHLPDEQLLLHAAAELPEPLARRVSAHMESCAACQARLNELQAAFVEVQAGYRKIANHPLPSSAGPRALLKAELAELSRRSDASRKRSSGAIQNLLSWRGGVVFASVALLAIFLSNRVSHRVDTPRDLTTMALSDMPNARFTPGAVITTSQTEVCATSLDASADIPPAMKTEVLRLYGIAAGESDSYEVDHLITPQLGGATDIRNLWPEPYDHTLWNAHVKDQLEGRLRELVCNGELDLATAQREISGDWIAAYRKYFHADRPLPASSAKHVES